MSVKRALCVVLVVCGGVGAFALLAGPAAMAPADVPEWFRGRDGNPYWAYEAWKGLSTTDAMLAVGPRWSAIGGVLRDGDGQPIANCPLRVESDGQYGRQFSVWLQTDAGGRFILYGVENGPAAGVAQAVGDLGGRRRVDDQCRCGGFQIRAAPGCPATSFGRTFADENKVWEDCRIAAVGSSAPGLMFVEATCPGSGSFQADSFAAFKERLEKKGAEPQRPFRGKPRRELKEGRGVENHYRVRVAGEDDSPVADALIYYMAYDGFEGNQQAVETDAQGFAELEEHLLSRGIDYESKLIRAMSIDVKGGVVGPLDPRLRSDGENLIRVPKAATVRGRLVDRHGEPFAERTEVEVRYQRRDVGLSFELRAAVAPDGSFEFDRVMPGEPFRLVASPRTMVHATPCHWGLTPLLEGESDEITLGAGEVRDGIRIAIRTAAPFRGIVVDERGAEVTEPVTIEYSRPAYGPDKWTSWDRIGEYGLRHGTKPDPTEPRFGDIGLDLLPIKFRARASGYQQEIVGPFEPKSGELLFIKIVLRKP